LKTSWQRGKSIKCDQKVNITAAFGAEMVLEGVISIPSILIKYYNKIGITDFQMVLLVQLIRLISDEKEYYPTPEQLADYMEAEPEEIRRELAVLEDKEIIAVNDFFDSARHKVFRGYDLEPLFLKVSDVWAGTRAMEIEEAEKLIRIAVDDLDFDDKVFDKDTEQLIDIFQNELGKLLSPMETEQIEQWATKWGSQLVAGALKEAVLRGNQFNFKYINKVLMDWNKNGVQTIVGTAEFEQQFHKRQTSPKPKKNTVGKSGVINPDKQNIDRNKEFIRSLYV
jgi:DNA replication protein